MSYILMLPVMYSLYSYITLMLPVMYSYLLTSVFAHGRHVVENVARFSRVNRLYVDEIGFQIVPHC